LMCLFRDVDGTFPPEDCSTPTRRHPIQLVPLGDFWMRAGEQKMRYGSAVVLAVAALALCGCGVSPGCRAVSTGALGAGTGAAIAAVAGGPVGLAAAIGGATGAVAGAATPPGAAYLGPSPICY